MGIDYYRCKKCNMQVDDCIGGYDHCDGCGAAICYNCTWALNLRKEPIDCETPGARIEEEGRWGFYSFDRGMTHEKAEDCDYELKKCPYCKKQDKAKVDSRLLKFLLKKCNLTRSKAIKEMNA